MTGTLPTPPGSPLGRNQQTALINLVRRAAQSEIMPRFRNLGHADVAAKTGRFDLVTEADTAVEALLTREILRMYPHALVVGEEAATADPNLQGRIAKAELAFVLDPLDGTWNFAHGLPLFGTIVAATRFGKPVFGLLYDPVSDDWIVADEGTPAHLARHTGAERPVHMPGGGPLDALSGYVQLYLVPEEKRAELAACLPEFALTTSLHCSCHHYRTLAQGGMDFSLSSNPKPWDHAAGVLICQQAGGVARRLDGAEYDAGTDDGYVLTAPDEESWRRLRDRFAFLLE